MGFSAALHLRAIHQSECWRDNRWRRGVPPPEGDRVVVAAHTWLLGTGWNTWGLLASTETPAAGQRPQRD